MWLYEGSDSERCYCVILGLYNNYSNAMGLGHDGKIHCMHDILLFRNNFISLVPRPIPNSKFQCCMLSFQSLTLKTCMGIQGWADDART